MGWRFRKSFKILPGIRMNIGKKGPTSFTLGKGLFTTNVNAKGVRQSIHVPGTGATYQTGRAAFSQVPNSSGTATPWVAVGTIAVLLFGVIGICSLCNSGSPATNSVQPKPTPASFYATPLPTAAPVKNSKALRKSKARPLAAATPDIYSSQSLPPAVPLYSPLTSRGPNGPKQSGYTTGPRGGCYYINSHGNKTYVAHSNCY